ncbi:hypothetical protein C8Q79DRAFT_265791 [Trametes meyenii]|nr:hypothetical protein C8Q79DRAFT_265791 [Trametes meyenii]
MMVLIRGSPSKYKNLRRALPVLLLILGPAEYWQLRLGHDVLANPLSDGRLQARDGRLQASDRSQISRTTSYVDATPSSHTCTQLKSFYRRLSKPSAEHFGQHTAGKRCFVRLSWTIRAPRKAHHSTPPLLA